MKQRKIPLRKCTGCQEMKDKREMIRIVKDNENNFSLDLTGKKAGRGAYICKNQSCLNLAEKQKGLERSYKMPVSREIYEQLRKELELYE
jgi:hypothetical protein